MLTERADEILGQRVSLVDIAADLAYKAFLPLGFRLWLYLFLIVGISHCRNIGNDARLGDAANKQTVRAEVDILLDAAGR